jgi:hypothetical protein
VVALLGPRQSGKTTLARHVAGEGATLFDLERTADRQALSAAPERVLEGLRGLVVLDEIQTLPELFPLLRVLADREPPPARFLILGSASPDLVEGASQTLAGRVAFVYLSGFDLEEVGADASRELWMAAELDLLVTRGVRLRGEVRRSPGRDSLDADRRRGSPDPYPLPRLPRSPELPAR